jgi:hypothetical protein
MLKTTRVVLGEHVCGIIATNEALRSVSLFGTDDLMLRMKYRYRMIHTREHRLIASCGVRVGRHTGCAGGDYHIASFVRLRGEPALERA